jgi:hypothetical protein
MDYGPPKKVISARQNRWLRNHRAARPTVPEARWSESRAILPYGRNHKATKWRVGVRLAEQLARHSQTTNGRGDGGGVPPQTIIDRDQQSTATAERARPGLSGGDLEGVPTDLERM